MCREDPAGSSSFGERFYMNISRRGFIRSSAAGLGLAATRASAHVISSEPVEALVIGRGFGGAFGGLPLAQGGIRAVVLGRGRGWPITPAPGSIRPFPDPDC